MHRVFLVPGFFGFVNLGEMRYFGHVHRYLVRRFEEAGLPASVHEVDTLPTASLTRRAERLQERIAAFSSADDTVHLVGHSSGGIDIRLLTTPDVCIGDDPAFTAALTERVRSVVTISSPHRGTPAAQAFDTLAGKQLLRLLSLLTIIVVRRGQLPLGFLLAFGDLLARIEGHLDDALGIEDELFASLLGELDDQRRGEIESFFTSIGSDQALLPQITPDAMQVFNSTTPNRDGIRYASVVTRAKRPGLKGFVKAGLSPMAHTSNNLYQLCHRLARFNAHPTDLAPALRTHWPDLAPGDNDGMVPASSQAWGRVLATVDADHLDIIGHFTDPHRTPPHYDWIRTGTGFDHAGFEAAWSAVFAHLVQPS